MENKKKRRYVQQEQPQVRKSLKKVYFQEGEETESSDEEITKVKCNKSKKNTKEASSSSESSSEEESEQQKQSKHENKKNNKVSEYIKKKIKVTKICKVLTFIFFKTVNSLKVTVCGGAMVCGNTLSSNKGTPANKSLFTETGDTLNYPRGHQDACKTRKKP